MRRNLTPLLLALIVAGAGVEAAAQPSPRALERQRVYQLASDAARQLEVQGRLREAVWQWRIARAVATYPTDAAAAISALDKRIAAGAAAQVAEGDKLRKARSPAAAQAAYEAALRLDPQTQAARRALRDMDTQAALRAIAKGGAGGPAAPAVTAR
ncbi:MAG: hypothetical protein ABIO39_01070 [Caulobacteraceae bacterium]